MKAIETALSLTQAYKLGIERFEKILGNEVAKAIESEWFKRDSGSSRYYANRDNFHRLRLYARGEQSIQKYKDELAINGDLSYLNLDWTPVPIIPKFVDIVVNGMAQRSYEVNCFAQDEYGVSRRTEYMQSVLRDMRSKEFNDMVAEQFGMNVYENKKVILGLNKRGKFLNLILPPFFAICSLILFSTTFIYFYNPVEDKEKNELINQK